MLFNRSIREEVVYLANGMLEAESIKAFLEANEIPAFLNQESAGVTYGFSVGLLGQVEVIVPLTRIEEAKRLIKEMNDGQFEDKDDEEK